MPNWSDPNSKPLEDMANYIKVEHERLGWTDEQVRRLYFGEWVDDNANS